MTTLSTGMPISGGIAQRQGAYDRTSVATMPCCC